MSNIYWSADTHIGHQSILKFIPNRPYASEGNMQAHDEWIISLWQTTVGKHDKIYFAGDLTFRKSEDARRLLEQKKKKNIWQSATMMGQLKHTQTISVK